MTARRILITGSADGLGRLSAEALLEAGHEVIVHARSARRLDAVRHLRDRGAVGVTGDLAEMAEVRDLAEQVLAVGAPDAVIHNAGVLRGATLLPVNVVAPYLLTALLGRTPRLIYLSSGMHTGGHARVDGLDWTGRTASASYSDTKLLLTTLMAAVARVWPDVVTGAVNPGWVPTKMGGAGAPDDLELGHETQDWLATSDDREARVSGSYWHHRRRQRPHASVGDVAFQDALVQALEAHTGVSLT